jgi:hypothetical protein
MDTEKSLFKVSLFTHLQTEVGFRDLGYGFWVNGGC